MEHHKVLTRWDHANGEVEKQNRYLEKRMRIAQTERKDWKRALTSYILAYRANPYNTAVVSPAEMVFGRRLRGKLLQMSAASTSDEEIRDIDREMKVKYNKYANGTRRAKISTL